MKRTLSQLTQSTLVKVRLLLLLSCADGLRRKTNAQRRVPDYGIENGCFQI